MAQQAVEQLTRIEDLDDLLRYLTEELGYEKYPALWEMWEHAADGNLRLTRQRHVDGLPYSPSHYGMPYNSEPVDPSFIRSNLIFEFDRHDQVQVVSQDWFVYRYRIAERCDARAIPWRRPPASQTAPDRQPKDGGLDPFRTGAPGRPTAAHVVLAEAERRIAAKEVTPAPGGLTAFSEDLEKWWEKERHQPKYNPPGPPMKAGSIKNVVRELWTAACGPPR